MYIRNLYLSRITLLVGFASTSHLLRKSTCSGLMLSSPSTERNKIPIGEVLQNIVNEKAIIGRKVNVFEVASGTGEHAAYFNSIIPNLHYQPSDPNPEVQASIVAWTQECRDRVNTPIIFDILNHKEIVLAKDFLAAKLDVIICINMIHISHFDCTKALFKFAQKELNDGGSVLTYGPYRVKGHMSDSNVAFDESLKSRNVEWGVRDLEAVEQAAADCGFSLAKCTSMPANNLCLEFIRKS